MRYLQPTLVFSLENSELFANLRVFLPDKDPIFFLTLRSNCCSKEYLEWSLATHITPCALQFQSLPSYTLQDALIGRNNSQIRPKRKDQGTVSRNECKS